MTIIVRKVLSASVIVSGKEVALINKGLLLYVGISVDDTTKECEYYAKKIAHLRIFESEGKDVSVQDVAAEILSVSQFTLSAETKKGNRPTYSNAMSSQEAKPLFDYFNKCLHTESNLIIQTGIFGADMTIPAVDDGPFTIIL